MIWHVHSFGTAAIDKTGNTVIHSQVRRLGTENRHAFKAPVRYHIGQRGTHFLVVDGNIAVLIRTSV